MQIEKQARKAVAARVADSPTASAIKKIHDLVGLTRDAIPLNMPCREYSATPLELPVNRNDQLQQKHMYMASIRYLEDGQELDDEIIDAICRIKAVGPGWTIIADRAFIPIDVMESTKAWLSGVPELDEPLEADGEAMLMSFPFLIHEHVKELIWILWYSSHWVTCVADTSGVIRIYNSYSGYQEFVVMDHAQWQMKAITSSPAVHAQWQKHEWGVQFMPCPQQWNAIDCGIFAIESVREIVGIEIG
ncbi:hypothetical protein NX059_009511 [Plenodomus lindquistii]|nr:hypothetical protein NX059_009511 [Plenodomus lindquistii]